jgi:hypothetical protein
MRAATYVPSLAGFYVVGGSFWYYGYPLSPRPNDSPLIQPERFASSVIAAAALSPHKPALHCAD